MKKGTILKNTWAGYETYFVYMGFPVRTGKYEAKATGGYSLVNLGDRWKFERAEYYIQDLKTERFPVVGYVDINRAMADVILQAISMGAEPPKEET